MQVLCRRVLTNNENISKILYMKQILAASDMSVAVYLTTKSSAVAEIAQHVSHILGICSRCRCQQMVAFDSLNAISY